MASMTSSRVQGKTRWNFVGSTPAATTALVQEPNWRRAAATMLPKRRSSWTTLIGRRRRARFLMMRNILAGDQRSVLAARLDEMPAEITALRNEPKMRTAAWYSG